MDFLIRDWAPYPRRFPAPFPVSVTCYLDAKDLWVHTTFATCNFSLILRGSGEYHRKGRLWPVQAPCVITQWPGEPLNYGPDIGATWAELYLIYPARLMTAFTRMGLVRRTRPIWPIANPAAVHALAEELEQLSRSRTPEFMADRVDRVCERMLLETLAPAAPGHEPIRDIIAQLHREADRPPDFAELARQHGMSPATFRRRWNEVVPTPPARYLQHVRLRRAARLLADTPLSVKEIAHAVGFEDEFHFSRRFRALMKRSPRDYRNAHRAYGMRPIAAVE